MKAKRLQNGNYEYRGFTIERNYESANGTYRTCKSQQGWLVFPAMDWRGDWALSLKDAVNHVDGLYRTFHRMPDEARWQVVSGIRQRRAKKQMGPNQRGDTGNLPTADLKAQKPAENSQKKILKKTC